MPKKSNLISETTMYSINPSSGEVVTHHLPWPRTSPQLETYTAKGFTFERPLEPEPKVVVAEVNSLRCDFKGCGFIAKSEFGLTVHKRRHK